MSARFYINLPLQAGLVEMSGPEVHHLTAVCRLRPGDAVCLFNGDGRQYPARVQAVTRKAVQLEIVAVEAPQRELPFTLEVAAPIPKGDRGQLLVEKLTELGVSSFVPLSCERSVIHPREGKLDKLHRHVIEASKQCGRNVLMRTSMIEDWAKYSRPAEQAELRLLAHPGGTDQLGVIAEDANVRIAVGPEGGFTDAETELALKYGWRLIDLGPRVLRIETAAIVLTTLALARGGVSAA